MPLISQLSELPRKIKILMMLLTDLVLLPLAMWSAIALRLGSFNPDIQEYYLVFFIVPFLTIPIFIKIGLYRAVIRFVDEKLLWTVFYGVTSSTLLVTAVVALARWNSLPRSSLGIFWIFAITYIVATRMLARGLIRSAEIRKDKKKKVAIYGAGRAGTQISFALASSREYQPVAFFDDDHERQGTLVAGLKIFPPEKFEDILIKMQIEEVILAIPSASRHRKREIVEGLKQYPITLKTLPGVAELVEGRIRMEDMRDVGIEDLLGRDSIPPIESLLRKNIFEKIVLISGAGGSIGSELCRQVAKLSPKELVVLDSSELALYTIEKELREYFPRLQLFPVLGDVNSVFLLKNIFANHRVQTVYHAAAYKHVPLVEANPSMGILNNAIGTKNLASESILAAVERFILISTDKAVRPTNVMGASKRLSELVLQAFSAGNPKTVFSMVRFGNVLGSSGSVVPLFREQIKKGGPVTVTHPDIIRYFMTIPEASQLVIQAGAMAEGGEVFILDMGEPVKIHELAKRMISLSGYSVKDAQSPDGDIEIQFTGLRPGEKLFEELLIEASSITTSHPSIFKAQEGSLPAEQLFSSLQELEQGCRHWGSDRIKLALSKIVAEYKPQLNPSKS